MQAPKRCESKPKISRCKSARTVPDPLSSTTTYRAGSRWWLAGIGYDAAKRLHGRNAHRLAGEDVFKRGSQVAVSGKHFLRVHGHAIIDSTRVDKPAVVATMNM